MYLKDNFLNEIARIYNIEKVIENASKVMKGNRGGRKLLQEGFSIANNIGRYAYKEVLQRELKVMDSTATSLCMDNNVQLLVFGLDNPENIKKVILGEKVGTIVK